MNFSSHNQALQNALGAFSATDTRPWGVRFSHEAVKGVLMAFGKEVKHD